MANGEKKPIRLHQLLAIESGVRQQAKKEITVAHHGLQHETMTSGQHRSYQPVKEDGVKYPDEGNLLQTRVPEVIKESVSIWTRLFDVIATRDFANCNARADVVVDGQVLLEKAPTPYLLWLEKQLDDLHTFVQKLPTLPADTKWAKDDQQNCYVNVGEIKTGKTAKVVTPLVLYEATEKHPAQVDKVVKDEIVGWWTTRLFSGALKATDIKAIKDRVEKLRKAVKYAREQANSIEITDVEAGEKLLGFVFGDFVK